MFQSDVRETEGSEVAGHRVSTPSASALVVIVVYDVALGNHGHDRVRLLTVHYRQFVHSDSPKGMVSGMSVIGWGWTASSTRIQPYPPSVICGERNATAPSINPPSAGLTILWIFRGSRARSSLS